MRKIRLLFSFFLLINLTLATVHADIVALYSFDGTVDTSSDSNGLSTAGPFSFNTSLAGGSFSAPSPGFSTNTPNGGGTNSRFVRTYVTGNTEAASVANNNFATFTVTANAGQQLNLQSLTMFAGSNGVNANGAGDPLTANTASYAVRTSVDNFASTVGTITAVAPNGTTVWTNGAVDLSGAAFQGLSSVTVRLYIYDSFDTTAPSNFTGVDRMDEIALNATVTAVPEPTSLACIATAMAGAFAWRRRNKIEVRN